MPQVSLVAPQRILIVRLSHLGDVVHALPVFHALRAQFPTARIGWAVQREFADLLRGLRGLDELFIFNRRGGVRAWRELRAELARWAPDWSIDAQGNWKSAIASWISGASRRSAPAREDWRERSGAWLATDRAPRAAGAHAIERMLALAAHVAPEGLRAHGPRFDVDSSDAELAAAARLHDQRQTSVVVHLATPGDVRSWPEQRFDELLSAFTQRGVRAWVVSGPAEAELGAQLARAHPTHAHAVGQRGLRELAACFTLAARAPASFVGCDSGPMHLAWACCMRVVCLSGPQDARRTGPWPTAESVEALMAPMRERAARGEPAPLDEFRLSTLPVVLPAHACVRAREEPECAPCFARTCAHAQGPVCMSRIEAADVLAALELGTPLAARSRA